MRSLFYLHLLGVFFHWGGVWTISLKYFWGVLCFVLYTPPFVIDIESGPSLGPVYHRQSFLKKPLYIES
jgi:hypothetical protein